MKRSTKVTTVIILFFIIITAVVVGRTMIGNHFKKKFSKRPPPGIIVKTVEQREFQNKIETFGTAIPIKVQSYNIEKYEILEPIQFNKKVEAGDVIVKLKNRNIIAPFEGVIGKRNFSDDIKVSVFFDTAVPKLSIFSVNSFLTTSVTIIPGGGLLLNFFWKWLPIIVLPTTTAVIIMKNKIITVVTFVDLFIIYIFPYSAQDPS